MNNANQILSSWQRTTSLKTDISDADWRTLHSQVEKGLLDAFKAGEEHAAGICKAGVQEVTGTHWELRAITQQSNNMCESLSKEILADAKERKELPE